MKKRIIAGICSALMMVGALSGCGPKNTKTGADGEGVNLRFSFWEASTGKETETTLQKIVDSYEADHPNVHIELVAQANSDIRTG